MPNGTTRLTQFLLTSLAATLDLHWWYILLSFQLSKQRLEFLPLAQGVEVFVLLHLFGVLVAGGDGVVQPGQRQVGLLPGEPRGVGGRSPRVFHTHGRAERP